MAKENFDYGDYKERPARHSDYMPMIEVQEPRPKLILRDAFINCDYKYNSYNSPSLLDQKQ